MDRAEQGTKDLTLKALYKLITQRDFPDYSYPVFSVHWLKGQTLVRFWRSLLEAALPPEMDLSIFDLSTKRSRSLTKLLNGNGERGFMQGWYMRLSGALDMELVFHLVKAWTDYLEQGHYEPEALTKRLTVYLGELIKNGAMGKADALFSHFVQELSQTEAVRQASAPGSVLFLHALIMAWLTLYALYASHPRDVTLFSLAASCAQIPTEELRNVYLRTREAGRPLVLTARGSTFEGQPLVKDAFIGRQEEMRRGENELLTQGKLAVTGMGGIGKTEFVRQLLARLYPLRLWRRAAYVQYDASPENSWRRAFPDFRDTPGDALPQRIRALLEETGGGRALLVIDNADITSAVERDWLNEVKDWGCDVIVTSRQSAPEGWPELALNGLDDAYAQALFLRYCPFAAQGSGQILSLCREMGGHPLALKLLAELCKARYWRIEELQKRLGQGDFSRLSFVQRAQTVSMAQVLSATFSIAELDSRQRRALRLMALLPYAYRLPDALAPLMGDVETDEGRLADLCRMLSDLGWLMSGDLGYALHPLIGEAMRLQPVSADEFPVFWKSLIRVNDPEKNRMVLSAALNCAEWNADCAGAVSRMALSVGRDPYILLPERLFQQWRAWLDASFRGDGAEADYCLALGIRDIVQLNRYDQASRCVEKLFLPAEVLRERIEEVYILLEYACRLNQAETAVRLFQHIKPADTDSLDMANWLISWSVSQRSFEHDPQGALESLLRARKILRAQHMESSLEQSNLSYRQAVCLLDLGRSAEAAPLIKECLDILAANGRAETAPNMMSTRNTYAVALQNCGRADEALEEYARLKALYCEQERQNTGGYALLMNNMSLLLADLGRFQEAEQAIRETLRIDETVYQPPDYLATHRRNAALILARLGQMEEAEALIASALALRVERYGEASPWVADGNAVRALILFRRGQYARASALIEEACTALLAAWGENHRHSRTALAIRREIRGEAGQGR